MSGAFTNYGDVNFFEYGLMIKDAGDNDYEILTCLPISDEEGMYQFSYGTVCLDDSWLNWEGIESSCDVDRELNDPFELVRAAFDYYGAAEFCGGDVKVLAPEEVQEEMEAFAEVYEFDEFPWRDGPLYW